MCLIAFVSNGFVSIFSKAHQIGEGALNTFQFSFWQSAIIAVVVGVLLAVNVLCNRKKEGYSLLIRKSVSAKSLGLIALTTVIMRAGSVLLLLAAKTVPASYLYPATTGISIFVAAIMGRLFFKEKISKINFVCILADIVAVVLMVF